MPRITHDQSFIFIPTTIKMVCNIVRRSTQETELMPTNKPDPNQPEPNPEAAKAEQPSDKKQRKPVKEVGGPKGLEPTRYGDWERKGIVSDF